MSALGPRAVVFGAGGAIGGALVAELAERRVPEIHALTRAQADILDEADLAQVAARLGADGALDTVIVATGLLHGPGIAPEKALRDLRSDVLAKVFAVNCIGPMLVMKYFLPLLARRRPARLAVLSARVGSVSDNRLGGWYAYRAAKAALNMAVRSAAIETARRAPQAMVLALHPGTVESWLSAPFHGGVPVAQVVSPALAAKNLADVLENAKLEQSGRLLAFDGQEIAP
ncbi:SDR family oxidoreductase [Acidocella sp.]|uniref:SDR family oxidoreductase n=1 Tax=Acidocella sp. TaxID=50710 RepID=UPI002614BC9D|nr:SDR family NAD(P)-dependent oxidoreductase [Acidocella sp.]